MPVMTTSHNIIIRMAFEPGDPQWDWRLAFFRSMCLPRWEKQTDQDFELWLRCTPAHNKILAALHPKIHPFQGYGIEDGYMGFPAEGHAENYRLPRSQIQTRVDCDDLVSPEFVARIHQEVRAQPDAPLIINFQPVKLDLFTLRRYYMGRRYHSRCTSMFLSLYQPEIRGRYWQIYDYNHSRIWQEVGEPIRVVTIPEGYCDLVVHDFNKLTTIQKGDQILGINSHHGA